MDVQLNSILHTSVQCRLQSCKREISDTSDLCSSTTCSRQKLSIVLPRHRPRYFPGQSVRIQLVLRPTLLHPQAQILCTKC